MGRMYEPSCLPDAIGRSMMCPERMISVCPALIDGPSAYILLPGEEPIILT